MAESLRTEKAMSNVLALSLTGGKSEQLSPLTIHGAKPAVQSGAKYRITDFTPGNCTDSNVVIPKGAEIR